MRMEEEIIRENLESMDEFNIILALQYGIITFEQFFKYFLGKAMIDP